MKSVSTNADKEREEILGHIKHIRERLNDKELTYDIRNNAEYKSAMDKLIQ